jgi:putative ABC transport system permease protein
MRQILRILSEGAAQAWQQLMANKLRSFLSLLGITIGIFCIIGVKSAVDSLEDNIRGSLAKLGSDVIYLDKFSWEKIQDKISGNGCGARTRAMTNTKR